MARKKTDFQIAAEFYAAHFALSALGILPRKIAVGIGLLAGKIGYLFLGKLKRVAIRNTEIAFPEISKTERENLVRGCFRSLGRQLGEVSQFPKATPESLKNLVEFPDQDKIWQKYHELKKQKRGMIFLTPHLGGWEIFALASSVVLGPQSYLVRRLDNPRIEAVIESLRGRFGNRPIDKRNAAIPAVAVLREGGNLGILPDINVQEHEGIFVPFFRHYRLHDRRSRCACDADEIRGTAYFVRLGRAKKKICRQRRRAFGIRVKRQPRTGRENFYGAFRRRNRKADSPQSRPVDVDSQTLEHAPER